MYTKDYDDIAMEIIMFIESNDEEGLFEGTFVGDKPGHIQLEWLGSRKPFFIDVRMGAGGIIGIDANLPFVIPEQAHHETLIYLSKVNAYRDPHTGLLPMAYLNLDVYTGIVSVNCSYFIEDREAFTAEDFEDYLSAVLNTSLCEFENVERLSSVNK